MARNVTMEDSGFLIKQRYCSLHRLRRLPDTRVRVARCQGSLRGAFSVCRRVVAVLGSDSAVLEWAKGRKDSAPVDVSNWIIITDAMARSIAGNTLLASDLRSISRRVWFVDELQKLDKFPDSVLNRLKAEAEKAHELYRAAIELCERVQRELPADV